MSSVLEFAAEYWPEIGALGAVVFGFWKYFDNRRRELAWRKTEFLFEQARYLDTDSDIARAIRVLTEREPNLTVASIYSASSSLDDNTKYEYQDSFDKLLNLLDLIAYSTLRLNTLTELEADNFGWYLTQIAEEPALVSYCKGNGLSDVITLAHVLRERREKTAAAI